MIHELKTLNCYFYKVLTGEKTFELRINDRDFKVGDTLILKEIDMLGNYTGRVATREITYILEFLDYLQPGYVVLAIK